MSQQNSFDGRRVVDLMGSLIMEDTGEPAPSMPCPQCEVRKSIRARLDVRLGCVRRGLLTMNDWQPIETAPHND